MIRSILILSLALGLPMGYAQTIVPSTSALETMGPIAAPAKGTVVIIPASGEVRMANDEAYLTFVVEEQDKARAAAASRVNSRMKEGIELMRRLDSQASLATGGYFTYPVYAEEDGRPSKVRRPVAWRVGQSLTVTTRNLDSLPQTVARAQEKLALQSLHFGLSEAARRKLDHDVMEDAYRRLHDRVASVAAIMGRNATESTLEQVDLAGGEIVRPYAASRMEMSMRNEGHVVDTPQFEPGETPVQVNMVARVRFP